MSRSGRGSSGGGRSSSSGGSRGFSGGMSSSGRSSRSSSSRSSSRSTSPSSFHRRPTVYRGYPRRSYYGPRVAGAPGCGTIIVAIIILMMMLTMVTNSSNIMGNSDVIKNTIEREPLPMNMSKETSYYTDELGWIKQPGKLKKGMIEFYKETGVQPHLYITDSIEGSSSPDNLTAEKWMDKKYDELFEDEAHLLMLFLDNGSDYGHWILTGKETKTVIDDGAREIIHGYLDRYVTSDLDDEEMFSTVFSKSAKSMMNVYKSPWIKVVVGIIVVGGIIIIVKITLDNKRKKKEQELKENQQTIDILNTPLEKINDYSDLENKYK